MNQIFSVLSPMRSGVGLKPRGDHPPSGNENADVNLLLNSAAGRTMFLTPTKSRSTSPASDPELDMPDLNSPAQQVTAPAPTTFAPTADEEVDYASVFPDFATGSQFSQVMAQLVRVVSDLDHPATSTHGQAMYQPTVRPSLVHRSSSKDLASGDSAVSSPNSRAKSPSVGQDADATTSPSPSASPSSLSRRRSAHEIALESSLRLSAPAEEEESSSDESSSDEEDEEEDDDEFEDMGFDDGENHVPRHFRSPTFDKFDKMLSPNSKRLSSAVDCNAVYAQYLAMRAHRSGSTAVGGRRGSAPKAGAAAPGAMPSVSGKASLSQVETRNRSKMCQELVSTERAYVASLSTLLKLYVQPLSDPALQKALGVSGEHITACFSNVQMIAGLHQQFLARLESATEDELFDVFVKQADFLKIYADFVGKFDTHTLRYLQQLNANKNFEAFCHAQEQQPESNGLPLNSLLIMPVQRVPRYQLLISGILKLTPADHATFDSVTRAHDKIKAIANHINESKRQVEQMDKLHTIQQQIRNLDRVLIQPWRRFIRTATAVRVSKSREYVFFLFNDLLLWISASSKQFKGVVEMQHAELPSREEVDEDDDGAQCTENELTIYCSQGSVTTPRVLTISFDSAHTRDKWAADIAKCISWSKRMQAYRLIRTNFASTGAERALSPVAASWMDTAPQPVEVTAPPQRKA